MASESERVKWNTGTNGVDGWYLLWSPALAAFSSSMLLIS